MLRTATHFAHNARIIRISRRYQTTLTFFTKDTCMLCTNAKNILHETLQQPELENTPIELKTIDIMKEENAQWFDVYCYDVPVLHVDRPGQLKLVKFMHYFDKKKLVEEFLKGEKRG